MPLRDIRLDDEDGRDAIRKRVMIQLQDAVTSIEEFLQYETVEAFDSLENLRDRLSEILDKAEGK